MPLLGFTIVEDAALDREFSFKLVQARKTLCFAATSADQMKRWRFVFAKVTQGEELRREDVYGEETPSRLSLNLAGLSINGSRLSSSSAESSGASVSTASDFSSRPPSLAGCNVSDGSHSAGGQSDASPQTNEAFQVTGTS